MVVPRNLWSYVWLRSSYISIPFVLASSDDVYSATIRQRVVPNDIGLYMLGEVSSNYINDEFYTAVSPAVMI